LQALLRVIVFPLTLDTVEVSNFDWIFMPTNIAGKAFVVSVTEVAVYVTLAPLPNDLLESTKALGSLRAMSLNCGVWTWNGPRPWPVRNVGESVEPTNVQSVVSAPAATLNI